MKTLGRLAVFSAALLLGLLLAEGVARRILPDIIYRAVPIVPDPDLGWKTAPNARGHIRDLHGEYDVVHEANSLGFHDVEHTIEKSPGKKRIVFLGDSFTEGSNVDLAALYVRVLENLDSGTIETINLGMANYGTDQHLAAYRVYGRKYRPDVVVSEFTTENDVWNNMVQPEPRRKPHFDVDSAGRLIPLSFEPYARNEKNKWYYRTYLYTLKREASVRARTVLRSNPAILSVMRSMGFWRDKYVPGEFESFSINPKDPDRWSKGWAVTAALYKKLDEEVRADGGRLLVVIFPTSFQVHSDDWDRIKSWYSDVDPSQYDLDLPNKRLKEFLRHATIPVLDLTDEFRTASTSQRLFFRHDRHPNPAGHALAAEIIMKQIRKAGLLNG